MTVNDSPTINFNERFGHVGTRGLPKYAQLREMLLEAIKSGYWKPGDKLPTELEFAEITRFSLGTVQRALRDLAEEGILVRRHGLGSFVAENRKQVEAPWHCRFLDDSGDGVLPIYSKTLARRTIAEPGPWTKHLGRPSGGLLKIDRLININNEFTVYSRFFADPGLLKPLATGPLQNLDGANFRALIMQECHLPITQVVQDVRVAVLDPEAAGNIGVKDGTTGMLVQAVARAGRDTCLYYQEFFIPPTTRALRLTDGTPSFDPSF
ncbi:GntR family transcriptional regulator [Azospirillum soli]|uniref:GntR family transcriptional regulator n=1 Tax=Azospirillum soli TaxID=1304799 RepID=UPI001AE8D191|nr:GntR family transcriptional regulator [Azospirillum soli]MBP2316174.1 DNA-binding GntR family transcriptional regulator [Azospirillum soli]